MNGITNQTIFRLRLVEIEMNDGVPSVGLRVEMMPDDPEKRRSKVVYLDAMTVLNLTSNVLDPSFIVEIADGVKEETRRALDFAKKGNRP